VPLDDRWYRILLNDQPAGHAHTLVTRTPEGHIQTEVSQTLGLTRADTVLEITSTSLIVETDTGNVVRLTNRLGMSKQERVTTAEVQGDKLLVTSGAGDDKTTAEQAYDIRARGPWWIDRAGRAGLKKEGDVFSSITVFPELQRCGEVILKLGKKESVDVGGKTLELFRRTTEMDLLPGKEQLEWADAEGTVHKSEFEIMGMKLSMILSSKENAPSNPGARPEILLSTAIKPDRPLPAASTLVYRFSLREGTFEALDLGDAFGASGQEIIEKPGPSERIVRISQPAPEKTVALPVPPTPELEVFLQSSSIVQSGHVEIRRTATQVCKGMTDAFEAAKRLERWVHGHIREKNLETAFASALEALQSASGDCTEHGVLLAALARAVGIPSRLVTGLVYHEGEFLGHLWTEVYIDRWIALDATRGNGAVGPDHIALATSSLSEAAFGDVVLQLARILGNLKIDVVSDAQ
jgi:hypothetical protein